MINKSTVSLRFKVAAVLGNAFEFYDFVAYSFFATQIGKTFFPSERPFDSLLLSLAAFGTGFLFRPLGAFLLGRYADHAGRRPALLLSILLMSASTLLLAVTPSYALIGVTAPIVVIFSRMIQGLALGGEFGIASAFLFEASERPARGFVIAWQLASQGMAALAAGAVGMLLSSILDGNQMQNWGWRIALILGLGLIPLGLYLRRNMPETLLLQKVMAGETKISYSSKKMTVILAILVVMGATISTYINVYMSTYAISTLNMPQVTAFSATIVNGMATVIFALAGGWLSDRLDARRVMLTTRLTIIVMAWPLFEWLLYAASTGILLAVTAILTALNAISAAASIVVIAQLFPSSFRATGVSIVYAISVSVFGASTQLVVTWLITVSGDATAPAWYLMFASVICACAMCLLPQPERGR